MHHHVLLHLLKEHLLLHLLHNVFLGILIVEMVVEWLGVLVVGVVVYLRVVLVVHVHIIELLFLSFGLVVVALEIPLGHIACLQLLQELLPVSSSPACSVTKIEWIL